MRRKVLVVAVAVVAMFGVGYIGVVQGWFSGGGENTKPSKPIHIDGHALEPSEIATLAQRDPVAVLRQALIWYDDRLAVKNYTCELIKEETINGQRRKKEVIDCWFRNDKYAILMVWKEGKGLASASLYNLEISDQHMFVKSILPNLVQEAPDSRNARNMTRYLITEFGLRKGAERTMQVWERIQKETPNRFNFRYDGVRKIAETGDRECHVIRRLCDPPEEEGMTEITIFIDAENWQMLGSELKKGDELIGRYYFRNVKFGAAGDDSVFTKEHVKTFK